MTRIMYSGLVLDEDYNGVLQFLRSLGMEKYWVIFKAKGYDRESDILDLGHSDIDVMHITQGDGDIILEAATKFQVSSSFILQTWLEENGLAHYHDNLRRYDVTELSQLQHLEVDEDVFTELEMDVPGHRKRFIKALNQLRKRAKLMDTDDPVAEGYWGKPETLVNAKNDFLCLSAELISTKDCEKYASLEFMVDSGSDVVTVRQEFLNDLDLELIGTIQSQGVHACKRKELFKGIIRIGGIEVETEVMSETYESIGNQVLRNFHHEIDSQRHFWYASDRKFLPPSDLIPVNCRPNPHQEEGDDERGEMASVDANENDVHNDGS